MEQPDRDVSLCTGDENAHSIQVKDKESVRPRLCEAINKKDDNVTENSKDSVSEHQMQSKEVDDKAFTKAETTSNDKTIVDKNGLLEKSSEEKNNVKKDSSSFEDNKASEKNTKLANAADKEAENEECANKTSNKTGLRSVKSAGKTVEVCIKTQVNKQVKVTLQIKNEVKDPIGKESKDLCKYKAEVMDTTDSANKSSADSLTSTELNRESEKVKIFVDNANSASVKEEKSTNESDAAGEMDCDDQSEDISDKQTDDYPLFTRRASNDPNFAVVFSFLTLFGGLLNLPELTIKELEDSLDDCTDFVVDSAQQGVLEKLHLKLLRRLSRSCKTQFSSLAQVSSDRLVKYLIRFSKHNDLDLAWDLEKFGYHVLGSSERLILLKALCEVHFDENPRFKTHFTDEYIKTDNIDGLRLQPFGRDISGKMIWFQQDHVAGFRVYSVEEDDADGNTWKLIASNTEELDKLVDKLKRRAEVNPKDVAFAKRKERKAKAKAAAKEKQLETKKGRGKGKTQQRKKKQEVCESESDEEDDNPCAYCYSNKRPDLVLLCDICDAAYHTLCLRPPLMTIPEGDWNCPYCQQVELIDLLEEKQKELLNKIKAIERASKRAIFDDIKVSNIVDKGHVADDSHSRRSGRQRKSIDYNFSDFDQMITDATTLERKRNAQANNAASFYSSTSRHSKRGLNNLDDTFSDSDESDYESANQNESRRSLTSRVDDFLERGCRRSRRLKTRMTGGNHGQEGGSSDSDDGGFVRRSSRRTASSQWKYVDYGTDSEDEDANEDVVKEEGKKKKIGEEDDFDDEEYEVSENDEEYEEQYKVRRRYIVDDDEEDDLEEEETDDEFENEELHEDFKKNVVDDESDAVEEESSEGEDEGEEETDDEKVVKMSEDSDDSDMCRRKKKKRRLQEDDESDEDDDDDDDEFGKKGSGKDMRNIIKSLTEDEKTTSKNLPRNSVAEIGSNIGKIDEKMELDERNERSDACGFVKGEATSDDKACGKSEEEDDVRQLRERKSNGYLFKKDLDKSTKEDELDNGKHGDEVAGGVQDNIELKVNVVDKKQISDTDKEVDKLNRRDGNGNIVQRKVDEKAGEMSGSRLKEDVANEEMSLMDDGEEIAVGNRKETPSPLFGEFENAELEKMGRESFMPSLNSLKQTSPQFQNVDRTMNKNQAPSQFYQHEQHHPGNNGSSAMPRRPDLLPISPQQGPMTDMYRPKPVMVGDYKQPYGYYSPQHQPQMPAAYSPMYNPFQVHSPQQPHPHGFYGGAVRQNYYPQMQSMVKASPPAYPGSSPSSSIWRPQEDNIGYSQNTMGFPEHLPGFSPRTNKQQNIPHSYPYIAHPDMNLARQDYPKDYGMSVIGSPASKSGKRSSVSSWPADEKVAPHMPSTTGSYAAFQSMVIGSATNEKQRKRPKKVNR
eukprot:gene10905-12064_t